MTVFVHDGDIDQYAGSGGSNSWRRLLLTGREGGCHQEERSDRLHRKLLSRWQDTIPLRALRWVRVAPVWQIKMASEDVTRIERVIVVSVAHVAVLFVARVIVAAPDVVIRFRREPATGASEREALTSRSR